MQKVELEVQPRKDKKQNLNQLRRDGWIPAVIYGHGESVSVSIESRTFSKAIHTKAGTNALFTIKLENESTLGIIKEVQKHLLTHKPIHVDFQRVSAKDELELSVPIHVVGEAPGVKNSGGILEQITREIRVRCLPEDIPVSIDIDVSHLELGRGIKVKEIPPVKGVEFLTPAETIAVNVVAPKVEEEKPVAAVEGAVVAGAEPEVIAKGKKEEEGAEKAGAAAPATGAAAGKPAAGAAPAKKEEKKK